MTNFKTVIAFITLSCVSMSAFSQLLLKKQEFTVDSKNELDYRGIPTSDILFYVSGEIQLKRIINVKDEAGAKDKGNVVFENGKAYAYLKFTSSATGKCDTIIGTKLQVRFENEEGAYLSFKKKKGKYDDVEKYYLVMNSDGKTVEYEGDTWEIIEGKEAYLFWKPKEKTKNKKTKEKVKGLKNDGSEKKTLKEKITGG